jgi:hypothetical protein
MPNPSIAIPTGSYAGSLNIAGSSKPGLTNLPRNGVAERNRESRSTLQIPHPHVSLYDSQKSWQLVDELWDKSH